MNKHVCLIFSPIDYYYQDALTHFAPPLGLVALANYIKREEPDCRVTILDGSVTDNKETICSFISKEKPDIVAQSIQLISYKNALEIAKHAKSYGLINVFGGHQATQLAKEIIENRSDIIDYVCVGDGEEAIVNIIRGTINTSPNLVFSRNGMTFATPRRNVVLYDLPPIEYSGINLEPYQKGMNNASFNISKRKNYLRIYSHKGCGNRGNSSGCVFCGRADDGVRFKQPEQFWQDMRQAIRVHRADYVFDVGDDFLNNSLWLQTVAATKPLFSESFELGIFGRANRVTPGISHTLRRIGVTDVVIGFESGDLKVLEQCGKVNTTPETNIRAAELLFQNHIDITASFVLGLPGETERSLEGTIDCAVKIIEAAKRYLGRPPREMVANLIEPSPGSPAYRSLVANYPSKYEGKDLLSLEDMQRDYFRLYFGLESSTQYESFRELLRHTALEIHSLVDFADAQGWLSSETADLLPRPTRDVA